MAHIIQRDGGDDRHRVHRSTTWPSARLFSALALWLPRSGG
jgi:hypothetical protein